MQTINQILLVVFVGFFCFSIATQTPFGEMMYNFHDAQPIVDRFVNHHPNQWWKQTKFVESQGDVGRMQLTYKTIGGHSHKNVLEVTAPPSNFLNIGHLAIRKDFDGMVDETDFSATVGYNVPKGSNGIVGVLARADGGQVLKDHVERDTATLKASDFSAYLCYHDGGRGQLGLRRIDKGKLTTLSDDPVRNPSGLKSVPPFQGGYNIETLKISVSGNWVMCQVGGSQVKIEVEDRSASAISRGGVALSTTVDSETNFAYFTLEAVKDFAKVPNEERQFVDTPVHHFYHDFDQFSEVNSRTSEASEVNSKNKIKKNE